MKEQEREPQGTAAATCLDMGFAFTSSSPLKYPKTPQLNLTAAPALTHLLTHGITPSMKLATKLNLAGLGAAAFPSPLSTSPLFVVWVCFSA